MGNESMFNFFYFGVQKYEIVPNVCVRGKPGSDREYYDVIYDQSLVGGTTTLKTTTAGSQIETDSRLVVASEECPSPNVVFLSKKKKIPPCFVAL